MRVAVLHEELPGGQSEDQKDTMIQVEEVSSALKYLGYEPIPITFSLDIDSFINKLTSIDPDFTFNLVESVEGKSRLSFIAPRILENLDIPFTGNGSQALFLTADKLMTKNFLTTNQQREKRDHMKKLMYTDGTYKTSPKPVSLFAKWFPSLVFYPRFFDIVFRASAKAKRLRYDDIEWCQSS